MKIHLPPGTTNIELLVNGSFDEPEVMIDTPYRARVAADLSPRGIPAPKASPISLSRGIGTVLGAGVLLVIGFTVGALHTTPAAQAALPSPSAYPVPPPSLVPYAPPLQTARNAAPTPQTGSRNVLQQLATQPTVTPPSGDAPDTGNGMNPFGLE